MSKKKRKEVKTMKETKIIALDGKNIGDYTTQINGMLSGGWKLLGSFGRNNMLMIFSRDIKVQEEDE